ncbi:ninein-like protein isoform X2 [Xenia sp. Carnegie-2017]|uniref:ninein-like protein isoform X2 n=1 Tax=Xenia sp. Carnegie-2017 TaxID=2897299 RepID=UPI001F03434B|nr:ninein-like protein isoform X2 [Xenia sp. Carnegie-2017]
MEEDQDIYVAQLREVFDSCDVQGNGFLNEQGLINLCEKLQLQDQIPQLLSQLLGNKKDREVNFADFKEGFVVVLSHVIDDLDISSSEEGPAQESEVPPKIVVNEKRYGRRSRPVDLQCHDEDLTQDEADVESITCSQPKSPNIKPSVEKHRKLENNHQSNKQHRSHADNQKLQKRKSPKNVESINSRQDSVSSKRFVASSNEGIVEGSDEISNNMKQWTNEHSNFAAPNEEQQLKQIWSDVNVGANGFLDKNELSVVCEHIGMENMEEEELSLLFDELDENRDGQVSFEEFLHGLFIARDKSHESDPSYSEGLIHSFDDSNVALQPGDLPLTSTLSKPLQPVGGSLFSLLDPLNTGFAKVENVRELWISQENTEALHILENMEIDSEEKVNLLQLAANLESVVVNKSDSVCQAIISIFKHELSYLRNQEEASKIEKDKLLENCRNLANEKSSLIRESEENTRQLEMQFALKIKEQEEATKEKIQQFQQKTSDEHEKAVTIYSKKILELEGELKQYKSFESRVKQEIGEKVEEIGRLNSTLNETQDIVEENERIRSRLEKEIEKSSGLTKKLAEVVNERDNLKVLQSQNASRGIEEIEAINRQLRDENDELKNEVEILKSQAKSNVKRNRSHRRRTTDRITRVGSVLSDYTKPLIIKRNKDGLTSSDESDVIDGKSSVVRVSGDGGSNGEEQNAAVDSEHKKTIEELGQQLNESERKLKNIETTVILQEQNIKSKDGLITKQKTSIEKLKNDLQEKNSVLLEKSELIGKLQKDVEHFTRQRDEEVNLREDLEQKNISTARDYERTIANLKLEIESMQRVNNSENNDMKERFDKELGNLTSQFTIEMDQLQQRLSREKDELELDLTTKYKALEEQYEGALETIKDNKDTFHHEKQQLLQTAEKEKNDIKVECEKKAEMLTKNYKNEQQKVKQQQHEEIKNLKDVINTLHHDKQQLESFFKNEKNEIEKRFAAEKDEIVQARQELYSLESTVEEMEKEKKSLENSLYQLNIKNTNLQDEILDLRRRNDNDKKELKEQKEQVKLVRIEMSTLQSACNRDVAELKEQLNGVLRNNELDRTMREKVLNDAKVEVLALNEKLEEKAKKCRDLEDMRISMEEKVRNMDRYKRDIELRLKKAQNSVDEHVIELNKQLDEHRLQSLRRDNLIQELYVENAKLTKTLQESEAMQKKAEKSNRQLTEQKRALQRIISKLCGANALA